MSAGEARDILEQTLEKVRSWYGFRVYGFVIMPEHVHLLMSEPKRGTLALVMQMLKQNTSRELKRFGDGGAFWLERYYDFNLFSQRKLVEKLRYMHRNPVARGLVDAPEDWRWSSYQHWLSGAGGVVEIESHWTVESRGGPSLGTQRGVGD